MRIVVVTTLLAVPRAAAAEPQGSVSLTAGVAGRAYHRRFWDETEFHLGLHGDVLFGRSSTHDFRVGPYAEVLTDGFDEIQAGIGASILLPIIDSIPLVLSAGPYGRIGKGGCGVEPGVAGAVFWGSRSYNFSANYAMSLGVFTQIRAGFGPSKETTLILGAQMDLAFLSLPIVFLVDAIRGGSKETDRVPGK